MTSLILAKMLYLKKLFQKLKAKERASSFNRSLKGSIIILFVNKIMTTAIKLGLII